MRYLWLILLLTGCIMPPGTERPVPLQPLPDGAEMPLVEAFCRGRALRMGADSGSEWPATLFSGAARTLGHAPEGAEGVQPCGATIELGQEGEPPPCCVVTAEHAPMDGLLGWPLLRQRPWYLDWARRHHRFADAVPETVRDRWEQLELTGAEHAEIIIPGYGVCMLDTGAPDAVYLPAELWWAVRDTLPERSWYWGESPAAGGEFVAEYAPVRRIRLGPVVLHDVRLCETFVPERPEIILGRGFLEQVEIWVDGASGVVYWRHR